jgi:hypothetical protein
MLAGAISFAAPDLRLSLERSVMTPAGLYAFAALRIAIGLLFVLAAAASRAPQTLRVLGLIVIIAGCDAVGRRRPCAGGPELVGECRAVVDAS